MTTLTLPVAEPYVSPVQLIADRRERPPSRWRWLPVVGRLIPLVAILVVQAALSWRLMHSNTAFIDEATYLGAGHEIRNAWGAGGGPNLFFETYFSGAPVIYPVLASYFDSLGGLVGARELSLFFMLSATILCYASARRIFGTQAGWMAAAVFAGMEGTQFLGALATYDSMALCLTAVAAWIVIRGLTTLRSAPHAALYLAAPVMALANSTKYSSLAYDGAVIGIAFCVAGLRYGLREATKVLVLLTVITGALLTALLAIAGRSYLAGVTSTTLTRATGANTPSEVLHVSWHWVGMVVVLTAAALVLAALRAPRQARGWWITALVLVLLGAALLAPLNQARIHTTISLSKHAAFGAWFGAIAVGYLLAWLAGRRWRDIWRYPVILLLLFGLGVAGTHQAQALYRWPNSTELVARLRPYVVGNNGRILIDQSAVPAYYFGSQVYPTRWYNTYYMKYRIPGTRTFLLGDAAYARAVADSYFSVIALDFGSEKAVDTVVAEAIHLNKHYHYIANVGYFVLWRYETSTKHIQ
jgi:Dolichyl-phosphate-mannose-protein mannosyltransferase